jgi:hypothetical protein
MNRKLLILGVAALALAATGASATGHKHKGHAASEGGKYAAPAQPIPYTELDSYVGGGGSHHGKMADSAPMSAPTTPDTSAAPAPK